MQEGSRHMLLQATGMTRSFPGVKALDGVDLDLRAGEVLAVIGENGSGKSTLMKILAGVLQPDAGEIIVDEVPARIEQVDDALALGIALIHQELNLAGNLDIGSNVFLGREPTRWGFMDSAQLHENARVFLQMVGLDIDSRIPVDHLGIGRKQLVEIARALSVDARILIMDEPTSSLSPLESSRLLEVAGNLRDQGRGVIYISHRLGEVEQVADRVLVLRDGRVAGMLEGRDIRQDRMVQLMVGRQVKHRRRRKEVQLGRELLRVHDLRTKLFPAHAINFSLQEGEIVGIAGLVGAGRTALLTTMFGITPPVGGRVLVGGTIVEAGNTRSAVQAGMALVPEDRQKEGLVLEMSISRNITLASLAHDQKRGFIDRAFESEVTSMMMKHLQVQATSPAQETRTLSGGNQQKVVLGKWLALSPRVLLLDEPTRGVDIGAKDEIYQLMESLSADGMSILFVSSELEEIMSLSNRVHVMSEGAMTGTLERADLTEQAIMRLAIAGEAA